MLEKWKDIEGYEGFYQISNKGRVKSLSRLTEGRPGRFYNSKEIIMKQKDIRGYKSITLNANGKKQMFSVHRLVLLHFNKIKNPDNFQCNHINFIKDDNQISNLEWCTPQENTTHAHKAGRKRNQNGESNSMSKLNRESVFEILNLKEEGLSDKEISKMYGVNRKSINNVINGKTWSHVTNIKKCND